jgi:uncharacterized protein YjdB
MSLSKWFKYPHRRATASTLAVSGTLVLTSLFLVAPGSLATAASSATHTSSRILAPLICYRPHVQDYGWMDWKCDGDIAGTMNKSKRLEALQIDTSGSGICVSAHVQDVGWQATECAGYGGVITVGTTGLSKRLEALRLSVPTGYVCANAFLEDIRWQGWRCGSSVEVGTAGESRRMEAVRICLGSQRLGRGRGARADACRPERPDRHRDKVAQARRLTSKRR